MSGGRLDVINPEGATVATAMASVVSATTSSVAPTLSTPLPVRTPSGWQQPQLGQQDHPKHAQVNGT